MPKLPGINHQKAIKAFKKLGFVITRQGKHVIPRSNPINAYTMFGIIKDAGITVDEFKKYL